MGSRIPRPISSFRSKWSFPISRQRYHKIRYIDNDFTGSTVAVTPQTTYSFSGNSLFDPDATGVGVQPYWYDTLSSMFNRYHVYAAKISVYPSIITPDAGAEHFPVKMFIIPANQSGTLAADPSDLMNMRNSQMMKFDSQYLGTDKRRKLTCYEKTSGFYPGEINDTNLGAGIGGNPTSRWYFQVIFDTSVDAANDYGISFDVKVVYYVRFSHQNILVQES